jgi:hypothetical protein
MTHATTVPAHRLPTPMGCKIRQECRLALGRALPRPKSTPASGQSPPRPILASATCSPRILQEATPSTVARMSSNPGTSLNPGTDSAMTSGEFPPLPSLALTSIYATERCPTSSYTAELTYYLRAFCHTQYCVNHYGNGQPLIGGSGMWPNPRPWPWLLAEIKRAQVKQQIQDHAPSNTIYRGTTTSPHRMRPTLVLQATLLDAINRTTYDFKEVDEHFTVFSSTTILALA